MQQVTIADHERAFVYKDARFIRFLGPGSHWLIHPFAAVTVRKVSVLEPWLAFPDRELLAANPALSSELTLVRVLDTQRGLAFRNGNFAGFLAPGAHVLLKAGDIKVEVVDVTGLEVVHPLKEVLVRAPNSAMFITPIGVADGQRALLLVDNVQTRELGPGSYYFWSGIRNIGVLTIELREQTLEVQGQEMMTQDKVSLRVNMTVRWQVVDAKVALSSQKDHKEAFYRDLQLALRNEVGSHTLDELLAKKEEVGTAILDRAKAQAKGMGIALLAAGLRDVILPGEMRTIFNQVIEAEKRAQANMIQRREETAATRNLMNTARLLENNPILMRMKELESSEKIAEKIGSLSVYGGLDGLMAVLRGFTRLDGGGSAGTPPA